jgi:hypothetical protein
VPGIVTVLQLAMEGGALELPVEYQYVVVID